MADVLHRLSCCPLASHLLHTTETRGETGIQLYEQLKSDKSGTAISAEAMAKNQCQTGSTFRVTCLKTVIFDIQYGDASVVVKSSHLKCHRGNILWLVILHAPDAARKKNS